MLYVCMHVRCVWDDNIDEGDEEDFLKKYVCLYVCMNVCMYRRCSGMIT